MFGPDTKLVWDAIQIAVITAGVGGGAVWLLMRARKSTEPGSPETHSGKSKLEQRVEVLERIATDRSIDLADEIEALRDKAPAGQMEGQSS